MIDANVFWNNVDMALGGETLISLAKRAGLEYKTLKNQRSLKRLPKLDDVFALSQALNLSIEHLILGKDDVEGCIKVLDSQDNSELQSLIRYIQADSNLLSALELIIKLVKADSDKCRN